MEKFDRNHFFATYLPFLLSNTMKSSILYPLTLLGAVMALVANHPKAEAPPAGAWEKITAALPNEAAAKPVKPRKLLVFSATAGFRHASIATGKVALTELGKKTGAFEAVVSDDLAHFEPDAIQQFDAICFLSTTQDIFSPHPEVLKKMNDQEKQQAQEKSMRLRKSLMDFVESGKGFVGIHAATDTLYNMPEYGRMIGGYFDGHPWTADKEVQIDIEKGQEKHPLNAMFDGKSLRFNEEIYQHKAPYDPALMHTLLRLNVEQSAQVSGMKRQDGHYGVSWARHQGKGRVFYCSLGHNHEIYWHSQVLRHYLSGIQWAIGDLKAEIQHQ
jgi:type 1 glutamine amidotransferase